MQRTICPYYALKDRANSADIIFMPYNYLVDPEIRFLLKFDLNNAVIIFDEAHNVPSAQEDVSSFLVREDMLLKTLSELRYL